MQVHDLIDRDRIDLDLSVQTDAQAIQSLVHRLVECGKLQAEHENDALLALLKREGQRGTNFGNSLAIPHARVPFVREFVGALGLIPTGIAFGNGGEEPARVVFLLLSPDWDHEGHLRAMREIVRLATDPFLFEKLHSAGTPDGVLTRLRHRNGDEPAP